MDSKTLAIIAALTMALTGSMMAMNGNHTQEFGSWKQTNGKSYGSAEEEAYRQAIYMVNKKMIESHNADSTKTYKMKVNKFADLTKAEFKSMYLGYKPKQNKNVVADNESTDFIGDVNWVTAGKVQHVKDQGQCGSCWAFSTVASSESLKAINTGTLGDFSEQQLVDCSGSYGNNGCNGGLMDYGFEYFRDNGICTESSYTYKAKDQSCKASSCTKDSFTVKGYTDMSGTSALKKACDKQPVSIAVDAENWSYYDSGVFSDCGTSLDHGVLLAGYTSSTWLVKNSWGSSWGEDGYIRLKSGNTCGLANQPSVPK